VATDTPAQPSVAAQRDDSLACRIARGYNAVADSYDADLTHERWMRRILHQRYRRAFRAGQRVLDLGCGTGLDTEWLVRQGIQVTAVDLSGRMLKQVQARLTRMGREDRASLVRMDLAALAFRPEPLFDGAVSAFAALDTLSSPASFLRDLARLLRPGALLIAHVLSPGSVWEWRSRARRGHKGPVTAALHPRALAVGGVTLHHARRSARGWSSLAVPFFRTRAAFDVGWLRPPHPTRHLPPGVVALLEQVEARWAGRLPTPGFGRFLVLELERTRIL
jgi:SAM-dependent methyltransferase